MQDMKLLHILVVLLLLLMLMLSFITTPPQKKSLEIQKKDYVLHNYLA